MERSLVGRVARSAALVAAAAALLAAAATSILGSALLQQAEDRRLGEAGMVLLTELGDEEIGPARIAAIVRHEHEETKHAGIRFAVAARSGAYLAGDPQISRQSHGECRTDATDAVRTCSVGAGRLVVTTAGLHAPQTRLFLVAAVIAVVFSGLMTWLGSRPMARRAVAPLSRLRARVLAIDTDSAVRADLGPAERVSEVDELRAAIADLSERLGRALEQAQRFAANAAHELRTPLTALRAELEMLAEQADAAPTSEGGLGVARTKVIELDTLVERLLILATPKSLAPAPTELVSLRDLAEDVLRSLPAEQRRRVSLSGPDVLVQGDAVLLVTMFTNGLLNALKFGESEVRVQVSSAAGRAVIRIDDDGPGIDPALRDRVFEAFFRGQEAVRRRLPGHGLGLALIRHVAESHGGSARLVSQESTGARLQIELPCVPS